MKAKLFDYIEKDNFVFNLSGMTKLLCFLILTFTVMYSYDARVILPILVFSFWVLHLSEIRFSQIKIMLYYVLVFIAINFVLTFLFSPQYGVELYGTRHELVSLTGSNDMSIHHCQHLHLLSCLLDIGCADEGHGHVVAYALYAARGEETA